MIRKPILPRVCGLLALYAAVFVALILMQFTKYGGFTRRIGALEISGQYKKETEESPLGFGRALTGRLLISYNGMEFDLEKAVFRTNDDRFNARAAYMMTSDRSVSFKLRDGLLSFTLNDDQSLGIEAEFDGTARLEVPYKPFKTARIQNDRGRFIVVTDKGSYTFDGATLDADRQTLILSNESPIAFYQKLKEEAESAIAEAEVEVFDLNDFVIAKAISQTDYEAALNQWKDEVYALFNGKIASLRDEKQIIAYESEALARGNFSTAKGLPTTYLNNVTRTFEVGPFFGRTDSALRSLNAADRETFVRINKLIEDKSLDFFLEEHPIAWLSIRGYNEWRNSNPADTDKNPLDNVAAWLSSIEPAILSPDAVPGIIEGYNEWQLYRENDDNPYARFVDRALSLVSAGLRRAGDNRVFVFNGGSAEMAFNVRLGKALTVYGDRTGNEAWTKAGRSLILSVLALSANGLVPKELLLSNITADANSLPSTQNGTDVAILYRLLQASPYYPRAELISEPTQNNQTIWTWTIAPTISAVTNNNMLDISVTFPAEETHYMLIRGIRPAFMRIELYNMNYRTDPAFESYNSSGWSYNVADQTLLLKMRHRSEVEHVKIFW